MPTTTCTISKHPASTRHVLGFKNGMQPVVRVMAKDIEVKGSADRAVARIPSFGGQIPIGRVVLTKKAGLNSKEAEQRLLNVFGKLWPDGKQVKFLITPGGFLSLLVEGNWNGNRGWASIAEDIDPFIRKAEQAVADILTQSMLGAAKGKADFMTIGIDVGCADGARAELVSVIDVSAGNIMHWTGKSYPTSTEERQLVQVTDLHTHFLELNNDRVMLLGCNDLTMFSRRGRGRQKPEGNRRGRCDEMRNLAKKVDPQIVLQHPHMTDTPGTWQQSWKEIQRQLPKVSTWASGICYYNDGNNPRAALNRVLDGTRSSAEAVVDIIVGRETA